jgi:uncharacterized SAM-binding protein YcdF (DUF218 family)
MTHRGRIRHLLLAALFLAGAALAFHGRLLAAAGRFLVVQDPLEKCDALVVLAAEEGDGLRVREAARLYREGWASQIVLSGGPRIFGIHETEWSLPLALQLGLPRERVHLVTYDARTIGGEAQVLLPELERSGARSVILITSQPDSRQVRATYGRRAGDRLRVVVRALPSPWFDPSSWWHTREGSKRFFYAWIGFLEAWLR